MISKLARRTLIRFCSSKDQLETRHSSFLTESEQLKSGEVPVHLRPYDKAKYEVPTQKIKRNSGTGLNKIRVFHGTNRTLPKGQNHENLLQYPS